MKPESTKKPDRGAAGTRLFGLLLVAVLAVFTAQNLLNAVLAPLSREVRLNAYQLGLIVTASAIVFTVASPAWGRLCDRWGTRRVLLSGLVICSTGLALFAVVCQWAMAGERPAGLVLAAMIATRSLLFGLGLGAVPVAALAFVGSRSAGEADRTSAISLVGAAQAVAQVVGPGLGGLLALFALLAPVYLAPVLLLLAALAVAVVLPRVPHPVAHVGTARSALVRPWDPRVWPFLLVGFLLFLSLGVLQIVLGFAFQDRLNLDSQETAGAIGLAGVITGLVLIVMQAVIVPRLGWGPVRLLRVGAPIAVLGYLVFAVAAGFWSMILGLVIITLGLGIGLPGFTAGSGMRVAPDQQGGVAGLVNATIGATYVVGPLLGTSIYEVAPIGPVLLCAGLVFVGVIALAVTPAFRAAPSPPSQQS